MEESLASSGLSLSEYSALLLTEEAGADGLAMKDVSARLGMSCSGFTRLARRMEEAGYLKSECCPSDGRVSLLTITSKGQTKLAETRVNHQQDIHSLFLDRLSSDQISQLEEIWQKLS